MQNINALPAQTIELKDIHIPAQISNFPLAYGWWLLAAFFILLVIISIIKIRKHNKENAIKKQALKQLTTSPELTIDETIVLLKWAGMHYFSRIELAKLFGNSLQQFLRHTLPSKHQKPFCELSEQAFLNQYKTVVGKKTNINKKFNQAAKLWLTHALPPKAQIQHQTSTINMAKASNKNTSLGAKL